jgi:hypothetical protein
VGQAAGLLNDQVDRLRAAVGDPLGDEVLVAVTVARWISRRSASSRPALTPLLSNQSSVATTAHSGLPLESRRAACSATSSMSVLDRVAPRGVDTPRMSWRSSSGSSPVSSRSPAARSPRWPACYYNGGSFTTNTRRNSNGCGTYIDWGGLYINDARGINGVKLQVCVDNFGTDSCYVGAYIDNPLR